MTHALMYRRMSNAKHLSQAIEHELLTGIGKLARGTTVVAKWLDLLDLLAA